MLWNVNKYNTVGFVIVSLSLSVFLFRLQDLVAFAKDNYPHIHFHGVLDLVNILANAAYRPEDFGDFSTFVVKVINSLIECRDCVLFFICFLFFYYSLLEYVDACLTLSATYWSIF